MMTDTWDVLTRLWLYAFAGGALSVVGVAIGLRLGRIQSFPPVRLIAWWLGCVILPWLRSGSWWVRSATIFVNNALILAIVVAAGVRLGLGLVCVAGLGISLGIGLRILAYGHASFSPPRQRAGSHKRWKVRLGVALNLLEPPAILIATGLCLGRQLMPLAPQEVWWTYMLWAVPLLLAAAGGEALWLGSYCADSKSPVGTGFEPDELGMQA